MNAKRTIHMLTLILSFVATSTIAQVLPAARTNNKDIENLNLEELLNMEILTVSKKSENISDAPGIVTTVTARQIELFGANNLLEVLERVPGSFGMWSHYFPQNGFSIRGDYPAHMNAHILLLINGRPLRESILGGFNSAIYTTFPLEAIERIEMIRGPGSVLYGTNAFAGVVNILTKKRNPHRLNASIGGGSLGTIKGTMSTGIKKGTLDAAVYANYFKEKGWEFNAKLAPDKAANSRYGEELNAATANLNYGNLTLNAFWGRNQQGMVIPLPIAGPGKYTGRRMFLDIGYEHPFSKRWTANLNLTYNHLKDSYTSTSEVVSEPKSNDIILEMTHHIQPGDQLNLLLGGSVNFQSGQFESITDGQDVFPVDPYKQTWWNFYLQADYRPSKYLKIIAGGQFNKPDNIEIDFVPRFAAIINASKKLGFKLLYGQAFRSAFTGETRANFTGTLLGEPNLTPEKVRTVDAQIFFNGKNTQFAATYFHSKEKDLITRIPSPVPGFRLKYANTGTLTLQGVEFEFKSSPTSNLFLVGSVVYQTNKNDKGIKGSTFIPNFLAKLGISYFHKSLYSISLFNTFSSKPIEVKEVNPKALTLNPETTTFNNLTANFRINLVNLFNLSPSKPIYLSFYGVNLLNQSLHLPEIIFKQINTVPSRAERAFYGSINFKF